MSLLFNRHINNNASLLLPDQWHDYELLDSGDGMKRERWGSIILIRPEATATWRRKDRAAWEKWDGRFQPSSKAGSASQHHGQWIWKKTPPSAWTINYRQLTFRLHPTTSKQIGIFPEQAVNWDWCTEKIRASQKKDTPIRLLNLFGYTGAASIAAVAAGATVCHVDSSKAMVEWCSENARFSGFNNNQKKRPLSKLAYADEVQDVSGAQVASRQFKSPVKVEAFDFSEDTSLLTSSFNFDRCEAAYTPTRKEFGAEVEFLEKSKIPIRFIVDDCSKFIAREERRGHRYDAIILDPPTFGRGSSGELWRLENQLFTLLQGCRSLLSETPLFLLLNTYSPNLTPPILQEIMTAVFGKKNNSSISVLPLALQGALDRNIIPCGITTRWEGSY